MLYIVILLASLLSADYVLASTDYTDEPTGYNQLLRHRFNAVGNPICGNTACMKALSEALGKVNL